MMSKMKLLALIRVWLLVLLSLSLPAAAEDTLWTTTLAQAKASKQLVAADIDIVVTYERDPLRPVHFRSHLSGWEKGNPVYSTMEVDPLPGASRGKGQSIVNMMHAIVDMAGEIPEPGAKVSRSDGQALDGKTWTVFQQSESGVGRKMASKIWVETETGCIHQVDTDLHVALYVDGRMKISYAADTKGRCLPRQIDANIDFIIPFKKMKIKMKQTASNWVVRPVASTP